MVSTSLRKILPSSIALLVASLAAVGIASGAMSSQRISENVCLTTGGGKIVEIPGFPGERIDRRLLRDVQYMVDEYKVFVTDGYSTDPIHSANGEHPIGLALDIVPDASRGGTWRDVGRLARFAEPKQNQPRPPFRWVGYNGDAHHGRGHHLHLSWNHEGRHRFGKPMRSVYTLRCPGDGDSAPAPPPAPQPPAEPQPEGNEKPKGKKNGKGKKGKAKDKAAKQPPPKTGGLISDDPSEGGKRSGSKQRDQRGRDGKGKKRSKKGSRRNPSQKAVPKDQQAGGLAPGGASATTLAAGGITASQWRQATRGAVRERAGADR